MKLKQSAPQTVDDYIASFPKDIRDILETVRTTIRDIVPEAKEKISYGMPTFELHGNLVYFAAYKNHIGFYPSTSGITNFKKELSKYKGAKGSVQFPLDEPMPLELIKKIVKFRAKENVSKDKSKPAGFPNIGQPALRALNNAGYTKLEQLKKTSEKELLKLHGMGPKALGILREALVAKGLSFKV